MDLEPLELGELSSIRCSFSRCRLPSNEYLDALVVRFDGVHQGGGAEGPHVSFMGAMIEAGRQAWGVGPRIVLDLRELEYVSGDQMGGVLASAPIAVVSDKCREGLRSLVECEMSTEDEVLLVESLEKAVQAVDRRVLARKPTRICLACGRPE
jgi:hypothetical protein